MGELLLSVILFPGRFGLVWFCQQGEILLFFLSFSSLYHAQPPALV